MPNEHAVSEAARAFEFAEYMAKGAEHLLDAMNEHAASLMALEESGDPDSDSDITELTVLCENAEQALGESMSALRSDIYEFRKRAEKVPDLRSAVAEQAQPSEDVWPLIRAYAQCFKDGDGAVGQAYLKLAESNLRAALTPHPPAQAVALEPVAWRFRVGGQNLWGYAESESDADFHIRASGIRTFEKQPLYASPPKGASQEAGEPPEREQAWRKAALESGDWLVAEDGFPRMSASRTQEPARVLTDAQIERVMALVDDYTDSFADCRAVMTFADGVVLKIKKDRIRAALAATPTAPAPQGERNA